MTARLVPWKGVDGVIKAVALLRDSFPDIHLVIHGDGPSRKELEELAEAEGVSGHVTFTGTVSRTETYHTRKESAIYILNSTYEGLPHTALSSFAAEIPIIATNIPGTNEAVYHERSGLLVTPGNTHELAKSIDRLLRDPHLQASLVAGGNEVLREKFSWDAHLAKLESFFETVTGVPRQ